MKKGNVLVLSLFSILLIIVGNQLAITYNTTSGDIFTRLLETLSPALFQFSLKEIVARTNMYSLLVGIGLAAAMWLYVAYQATNKKNFMHGIEHGSARWGDLSEAKEFMKKNMNENIILSKHVGLALYNQGLPPESHTNKNVMIIGGSGAGKTRFFVKPNILQCNSCYIVTDPKGTCMPEVANALKENGYKIKYVYTIAEFLGQSMHYNPFHYVKTEAQILQFIEALISNTKGEGRGGDDFWEKSERLLYAALIGYVIYEGAEHEKNFDTFLTLFDGLDVREDDESYVSPIDILFEELGQTKPNHFAVRQYRKFKMAAGKTAKSILISCAARLSPFDIQELRELLTYDELELDKIGFEKTAFFIILDDTDPTFNFLIGILYTQMLNILIRNADRNNGSLPIHTRFILDEFANTGQIPHFETVTGQIRSREISVNIILQNKEQLKALYKEKANVIMGNCDSTLFLGSDELETGKYISEKADKTTIDNRSYSTQLGEKGSTTKSEQNLGRSLITPGEVRSMPVRECIVFTKGKPPFKDLKYPLESHPNYKLTGDYDKNLIYHPIEKRAGELECEETKPETLEEFLQDVEKITAIDIAIVV